MPSLKNRKSRIHDNGFREVNLERYRGNCHYQISNHLLIQSIAGTVIAKASVEIKSMDAVSDWAALYRAAKSTATGARGKLQHTGDSRAKGLMTC
jgi:hypothetical protein